jgi:hypothetical protein
MKRIDIKFLAVCSFLFLSCGNAIATDNQLIQLTGKKAVEQFMDYHFLKENDPIIAELQKQYLDEGKPTDFSDVVKDPELQKTYLVGYGYKEDKKNTRYVFLVFHEPMFKTVYSVYKKGKSEWYLVGEIPSECKYGGGVLRLEKCPKSLFVSVLNSTGGSGVFEDRWVIYAVGNDYVLPVSSYPNEGYRNGWDISYDVEYKASEINWKPKGKQWDGQLDLDIKYLQGLELAKEGDEKNLLFEKNNHYFVSWNELKAGFVWTDKDGKPTDPFGDISVFDSDQKFMKKYKTEIEDIGQSTDPSLKAWYKAFLESIRTNGRSKAEE